MTASRDSAAYERYEERFMPAEKDVSLRQAPSPRRRKKARAKKSVAPYVLVVVLAAVYMLFCQMRLTILTAEVTTQSSRLDELSAENVYLSSTKTSSMDRNEIEQYAVDRLGMVKMDNSQIEYVELTNPDTITVAENGLSLDALFAGLVRSFSAIVEYIS